MSYRSGSVALIGKPNVGKSTLGNQIVGRKVAITSKKPQTTRQRMLGVLHGEDYQAVLVDTPGIMDARRKLHHKMVAVADQEARQSDLTLWLVELTHPPTEEDQRVAELVRQQSQHGKVWLVMNKSDRAKEGVEEAYLALEVGAERSFRLSAKTGEGVSDLLEAVTSTLPEGPPYFPPDQVSEQNDRLWMAEVIREKVLDFTRQEVPHGVAITVEELRPADKGEGLYGRALLYVERKSQKRIVIGKDGAMLKKIGMAARQELEEAWGQSLYLDLWVKVKEDWRDREDWLRIFGY